MSLTAIFANGSSLRDLRSRDTGQLEKGKHKSLELSRERFTVYRGAIFEIESLIRKCWWSDPVEDSVTCTMSGSFRCHLTGGLITSSQGPLSCAVTDMSSLFVHCRVSAITIGRCNKWVTTRYMAQWLLTEFAQCSVLDYYPHQHLSTQEVKQETLVVMFQDSRKESHTERIQDCMVGRERYWGEGEKERK